MLLAYIVGLVHGRGDGNGVEGEGEGAECPLECEKTPT